MMPANAKVESAFFALISKNHKENLGNSLLDETIGKIELSGLGGGEAGFEGVADIALAEVFFIHAAYYKDFTLDRGRGGRAVGVIPLLILPLYPKESCWVFLFGIEAFYSSSFANDVIFNNIPSLVIS